MSRYFFDFDDGLTHSIDDEGTECDSLDQAKKAAFRALPDMARELFPNGECRHISVQIRDEEGSVVAIAVLTLAVSTWLAGNPLRH
jgi:hypothetical protein